MYRGHALPDRSSGGEQKAPRLVEGTRWPAVWLPSYATVKRVIDVIGATAMLLVLLPLLVGIGVAITLSMGPPLLFHQRRIGVRGQDFVMWKFRTMRADRRLSDHGPLGPDGERRCRHKTPLDPRVTRLGRFLRRTCLDEFPQLWNVLKGDMSLVGPRPELPAIVARYEVWQHTRHNVRPGLTGWWQINRTSDRLMHESVEDDLYYVQHCSFSLDMLILLRTVGALVRGAGAY